MMEIYTATKKLAPSELDILEKSDTTNKLQPSEEVQVKTIDVGTGDSRRLPPSGSASTRNRKTRSSASSGLTEISSLGNQRACQGCPGG
jgi:hypothetical protein